MKNKSSEKVGRRKPLKELWPWKIGGNPNKRRFVGLQYVDVPVGDGTTVKRRVCSNCEDSAMAYQGLGNWLCENCGYNYA